MEIESLREKERGKGDRDTYSKSLECLFLKNTIRLIFLYSVFIERLKIKEVRTSLGIVNILEFIKELSIFWYIVLLSLV